MKKIKLKGKLSLNKETIAKLNDEQMSNVIGGELSPKTASACAGNTCIAATCVGSGDPVTCVSADSPNTCRFCN